MVAFTVLFFLLLVSVMTAVAIMAALKAVDFFDESRAFHRRMDAAVDSLEEIVRLLEARRDEEVGE